MLDEKFIQDLKEKYNKQEDNPCFHLLKVIKIN